MKRAWFIALLMVVLVMAIAVPAIAVKGGNGGGAGGGQNSTTTTTAKANIEVVSAVADYIYDQGKYGTPKAGYPDDAALGFGKITMKGRAYVAYGWADKGTDNVEFCSFEDKVFASMGEAFANIAVTLNGKWAGKTYTNAAGHLNAYWVGVGDTITHVDAFGLVPNATLNWKFATASWTLSDGSGVIIDSKTLDTYGYDSDAGLVKGSIKLVWGA